MSVEKDLQEFKEKLQDCSPLKLHLMLFYYLFIFISVIIGNIATTAATVAGAIYFYLTALDLVRNGNVLQGILLFFISVLVILNVFRFVVYIRKK